MHTRITRNMICREAVRLLSNLGVRGSQIELKRGSLESKAGVVSGLVQHWAQFDASTEARTGLELDDYSEKIIAPAMKLLAEKIDNATVVSGLEIPQDVQEVAIEKYNGIEARFVTAFVSGTDGLVSRIDVLCMSEDSSCG